MSEFVFLFRSTVEDHLRAMGTPEAAQRSMQAWFVWMRELEAKGCLKNPGQPLDRAGRVVRATGITDGPYMEAKDLVLGFITVEARDIDHAAELAAGCPMARGSGLVEVRPVSTMPA